MKKALIGALGLLSLGVFAIPFHSADAQVRPSPNPILKALPSFGCSAMVSGTSGTVIISKTNAVAVDKTRDVVAVVQTPSGKVTTAVCGATFTSAETGTKVSAPFTAPATNDKTWIYTCSAMQAETTSACNPPK